MHLAPGHSLSHYEILAPLGAGAMGEVYRARDTRLEREVAIKVLPDELAGDDERLRRFEREAKVLAQLNHPNVAGIHGVDAVDDTWFLALELVPGEDLAARLRAGPLPIDEALDVARQIAEGLEAAHEAGVVHRDLKPANVRVTPDGAVKLLDFGLAKARTAREAASADDSVLTTADGVVLGTPTYMAPEQARGRAIDRRVDLWALGCVLYECLAGRRAFEGESFSDVIAAVLEREPDLDALPARTPARVRELIARCLAKEPRQRLRDAGDARIELERALAERAWARPAAASATARRPRTTWLAFGAAVLAGLALGRLVVAHGPAPARELRLSFPVDVPYQQTYPRIAPDGSCVVHDGLLPGEDEVYGLHRRDLDAFESVPLPDTARTLTYCFSPDSTEIVAIVERSARGGEPTLVRLPLRGDAPAVVLGACPPGIVQRSGIVWLERGVVVGTRGTDLLWEFPVDGGAPVTRPIRRGIERQGDDVEIVRGLGDGRHVIGNTFYYDERGYRPAVVLLDVETGEERLLVREAHFGAVVGGDRLLFTRDDTLFTGRFDARRLVLDGPAEPIAEGLRTENSYRPAWFDVARDGTLVWLPGGRRGGRNHLALLDRTGTVTPFWPERMRHDGMLLAGADGTWFTTLVVTEDGQRVELWGSSVDRPALRRLLAEPGVDFLTGHFLPGGREMVYRRVSEAQVRDGIYRVQLDAPDEPRMVLPADPDGPDAYPAALTPDGELLVLAKRGGDGLHYSTLALDEATGERDVELVPLLRQERGIFWPKFSDDGRWLAYSSEKGVESEVVVRRFEGRELEGAEVAVPTPHGGLPWDFAWSTDPADGANEIVLVADDRRTAHATHLVEDGRPRFEPPRRLGAVEQGVVIDMASVSDGRVLLMLQDPEDHVLDRVDVVVGALEGSDPR